MPGQAWLVCTAEKRMNSAFFCHLHTTAHTVSHATCRSAAIDPSSLPPPRLCLPPKLNSPVPEPVPELRAAIGSDDHLARGGDQIILSALIDLEQQFIVDL